MSTDIGDSFNRLLGRQATDAEMQRLLRVRDALGLKGNDALWLIIMSLDHYEQLYAAVPAQIQQAAKAAAAGAAANAQHEINAAVAQLVPSIRQQITGQIASVIETQKMRQTLLTYAGASIMLGVIFGLGMWFGTVQTASGFRADIGTEWRDNFKGLIALGSVTPGLILAGVIELDVEKYPFWVWVRWVFLGTGLLFIVMLTIIGTALTYHYFRS